MEGVISMCACVCARARACVCAIIPRHASSAATRCLNTLPEVAERVGIKHWEVCEGRGETLNIKKRGENL